MTTNGKAMNFKQLDLQARAIEDRIAPDGSMSVWWVATRGLFGSHASIESVRSTLDAMRLDPAFAVRIGMRCLGISTIDDREIRDCKKQLAYILDHLDY